MRFKTNTINGHSNIQFIENNFKNLSSSLHYRAIYIIYTPFFSFLSRRIFLFLIHDGSKAHGQSKNGICATLKQWGQNTFTTHYLQKDDSPRRYQILDLHRDWYFINQNIAFVTTRPFS